VLDDHDLHEAQQPLALAQARAIATSLNTLVFHTHFPLPPSTAASSSGGAAPPPPAAAPGAAAAAAAPPPMDAATLRAGRAMLAEHAPLVLRALYERDVRRPFCQPALWLAPYTAMMRRGSLAGGAGSTGGSSVGGGSAPTSPTAAGGRGPAAPASPTAPAAPAASSLLGFLPSVIAQALLSAGGEGGSGGGAGPAPGPLMQARAARPAAVASLLKAAPQCVPFPERVEFFRALVQVGPAGLMVAAGELLVAGGAGGWCRWKGWRPVSAPVG
jgi:ubiquitin-protein ligase E3 C